MKLIYRESDERILLYLYNQCKTRLYSLHVTHMIYYINIYNFNYKKKGSETFVLTETALRI